MSVYALEESHLREFWVLNEWKEDEPMVYREDGFNQTGLFDSAELAWKAAFEIANARIREIDEHGWNHKRTQYAIRWRFSSHGTCFRVRETPMNVRLGKTRLVCLSPEDLQRACGIPPIEFPMSKTRKLLHSRS